MMKDVNLLTNNGVNVQKSLEIFGDMETYDETLQTFLAEVEGKLSKIKGYKETADMAQYAILVHSLKSDARYFGFEKLAEIAYKHELESKENNIYFVTDNFDELMTESNRIVDLVKKYLSGASADSIQPASAPQPICETPIMPQPAASIDSTKRTIIVVDDSDIIRNFIGKIFADQYNVLIATDGAEAINTVASNINNNISGMLLDLAMPNVDGFAVLEYFKQNNLFAKIPVVIITGNDTRETDQKAFEYPIVDMLKKPFNERSVKDTLEKIHLFNSRNGN